MGASCTHYSLLMQTNFQYIIIGAGCAGLQLAYALLQLPENVVSSILIIENLTIHQEKSWCFWYHQQHPYHHLVAKQWSHLTFATKNFSTTQPIQPLSYQYINSSNFYQYHLNYFKNDDRIQIIYQSLVDIVESTSVQTIITNKMQFTANCVFYSIDYLPKPIQQNFTITQHFLGWIIETNENVFEVDKATFMDFSHHQSTDIQFIYILPFSATTALIECTFFSSSICSDEAYEEILKNYLSATIQCQYAIQKKETGKIPMSLIAKIRTSNKNIIPIGTAAGCIKASTGYSFTRAMEHTQQIINAIKHQQNILIRTSKKRFLFYDRLFLHIISAYPASVMINIFNHLFKYNQFKTILQFLDEKTSLLQEIKIFIRLPKLPFLKAILKLK